MLTLGSLCTGFGGLDHAVADALGPVKLRWVADPGSPVDKAGRWDDAPVKLLAHHYPGVPNLGDIAAADAVTVQRVNIIAAGFPCTDVSLAGRQEGLMPGTRSGLWVHVARFIAVLRPDLVILENVGGLLSARAHSDMEPCPWCVGDAPGGAAKHRLRALGAVLGDLASLGFDAEWVGVRASDVGAAHQRFRIFIVAWPADTASHTRRLVLGNSPDIVDAGPYADRGLKLFKTPTAQIAANGGAQHPSKRKAGGHDPTLDDEVAHLLPTPDATHGRRTTPTGPLLAGAVELLPTPRASDGDKGGSGQHGRRGDLMLPSAVALLPTPTADRVGSRTDTQISGDGRETPNKLGWAIGALLPTPVAAPYGSNLSASEHATVRPSLDGVARRLLPTPTAVDANGTRNATSGRSDPKASTNTDGWTLGDVAYAGRWGAYAAAIARWEAILGRSAPEPVEAGRNGRPRLAARFVEWLMGCDDGYVCDVPGLTRNQMLRLLGNGVVRQQGAYGIRLALRGLLGSGSAA